MQITACRVCGNKQLTTVIDIGNQSLTGCFPRNQNETITSGPLSLVQCDIADGCGLVQLKHSYDLNEMYGENYGYRSGLNNSMVRHLENKIKDILSKNWLEKGDIVVDIGSNDGTTLGFYPQNTFTLVGIDPSARKFASYYRDDIITVPDFFSLSTFQELLPDKQAKVVTSFSMFYDLESPIKFARDVAEILCIDGIWCFEQSYLPKMLATNSFDTICHEHIEYYGLTQIKYILEQAGLKILDVSFNDVNGGSFSVIAGKDEGKHQTNSQLITSILQEEERCGFNTTAPFDEFKLRIEAERKTLLTFLKESREQGKKIAGFGASTKGNVLLQYYGITSELVYTIAEVNSDKYGCYTPGTNIPIRPQNEVLAENPDYLLVLPWHFRKFFETLPNLKNRKLIFPLPTFEIVTV